MMIRSPNWNVPNLDFFSSDPVANVTRRTQNRQRIGFRLPVDDHPDHQFVRVQAFVQRRHTLQVGNVGNVQHSH